MGSLMAGWDSNVPDPKLVKLQRNRSSTKEEIETYWRSKKKKEEEHLKAISDLTHRGHDQMQQSANVYERSSSLPSVSMKEYFLDRETEESLEKNGWWISSKWAFLNEPPVIEGPTNKYASQFHIANVAASKSDHAPTGISAS
ncbi:hypothetical protein F0562_027216 [Nyssa sinensis]|uniref:Uncharacterized protein n=1 Tax=Nyssa sinensis TaxID=561372 RepID=A0A5J5B4Q4_9ASTE|nr:hypothetical protein F0562_027216 [Nyssa sinensis]